MASQWCGVTGHGDCVRGAGQRSREEARTPTPFISVGTKEPQNPQRPGVRGAPALSPLLTVAQDDRQGGCSSATTHWQPRARPASQTPAEALAASPGPRGAPLPEPPLWPSCLAASRPQGQHLRQPCGGRPGPGTHGAQGHRGPAVSGSLQPGGGRRHARDADEARLQEEKRLSLRHARGQEAGLCSPCLTPPALFSEKAVCQAGWYQLARAASIQ